MSQKPRQSRSKTAVKRKPKDFDKSRDDDLIFESKKALAAEISANDNPKTKIKSIMKRSPSITYKTERQEQLAKAIRNNWVTFATGAAGTGKSFVAIAEALRLLFNPDNNYETIVVIKPAVELVGEKLGFLPGEASDKISVYAYSSLCLVEQILDIPRAKQLVTSDFIRPAPLAYIRGSTFGSPPKAATFGTNNEPGSCGSGNGVIVILEEAQNMSKAQMKTFLTRIGENSKIIITGDTRQSDVFSKNPDSSGLADAERRLEGIDGIEFVHFTRADVVRHPMIKEILGRYEDVVG